MPHIPDDTPLINEILDFWYEETPMDLWFDKDDTFDQQIRDRFGEHYEKAKAGIYDHWAETPEGALALIIVLDQFPRNMFRNDSQAYQTDKKAVSMTKTGLTREFDRALDDPLYQHFFYIPLMHSERLADQELSVLVYDNYPEVKPWAIQHRDIIKKFGRFPQRNEALGRDSTPEEIEFLNDPKNLF